MAAQYFIKRGETVNGPFSVEKLQALKKAKKLKAEDEICQSRKGPWDRLGAVYKSILKEDRVDDYEDDVVFYEDDDDGYEDDDDGYEDAPPPRRKQSKSTKVKRSSKSKKPSKPKKQSSRGMILGMSYYFLGATALVLALIAVVYVQFFSLDSRADRLAERMIALEVQSKAIITSIGQSEDMETIRARGARAEAKNLELGRVATELTQLKAQMTPEQRARWEEKWINKLLGLK